MNFTTVKTKGKNHRSVQKDKRDHIQRIRNRNGTILLNIAQKLEDNEQGLQNSKKHYFPSRTLY